jgi:hypothetical protein
VIGQARPAPQDAGVRRTAAATHRQPAGPRRVRRPGRAGQAAGVVVVPTRELAAAGRRRPRLPAPRSAPRADRVRRARLRAADRGARPGVEVVVGTPVGCSTWLTRAASTSPRQGARARRGRRDARSRLPPGCGKLIGQTPGTGRPCSSRPPCRVP